jgi:hypothetical protein
VAHAFNPSTREAGAGGFLSSRSAWPTKWVPGQPGLYRETLSRKTKKKKKKELQTVVFFPYKKTFFFSKNMNKNFGDKALEKHRETVAVLLGTGDHEGDSQPCMWACRQGRKPATDPSWYALRRWTNLSTSSSAHPQIRGSTQAFDTGGCLCWFPKWSMESAEILIRIREAEPWPCTIAFHVSEVSRWVHTGTSTAWICERDRKGNQSLRMWKMVFRIFFQETLSCNLNASCMLSPRLEESSFLITCKLTQGTGSPETFHKTPSISSPHLPTHCNPTFWLLSWVFISTTLCHPYPLQYRNTG